MNRKEELLQELSNYIHLDSGRKRRSDSGVERKPYKPRQTSESAASIFNRIKGKLQRKHEKQQQEGYYLFQGFDDNGFYLPIPAEYKNVAKEYVQEVDGRRIEHTTTRVRTQKYIDLEMYRFNMWKEMATSFKTKDRLIDITPEINGILFNRGFNLSNDEAKEFIRRNAITYREWFCYVYHLDNKSDISVWDYEVWREHFECCPYGQLDESFVFNYEHKPGTPEFMPEWAEYKKRNEDNKAEEQKRKAEQYIANMKVRRN